MPTGGRRSKPFCEAAQRRRDPCAARSAVRAGLKAGAPPAGRYTSRLPVPNGRDPEHFAARLRQTFAGRARASHRVRKAP